MSCCQENLINLYKEKEEVTTKCSERKKMDFNGFFDFGTDSDDFFNVGVKPKKEEKKVSKQESVKEKTKEKTKKASAGKGNKAGTYDCDVALPVTVKGRGFRHLMNGTGTIKMSELADKLIEVGLKHIMLPNIGLFYIAETSTVFVTDSSVVADDAETMVLFDDENSEVTVADGYLQSSFKVSDFEGKELDEVTLADLANKFALINPEYEGCKLLYDAACNIAYPVIDRIYANALLEEETVTVIVNGERQVFEGGLNVNELCKKIAGVLGGAEAYLAKTGSMYFLSYTHGKEKYYAKNATVVVKNAKKVEKKYVLPLDLYIVTWNMHYTITSDMFGGKEKVTQGEVIAEMAKRERMFADKDRKVDFMYNEEQHMLSCMFVSGKKGAALAADAHTGIWKMIRSEKELNECRMKDQFLGLYHEAKESFKIFCLPHGNFYGYFGKELECCTVKRVEFERKLPKIDRSLLDNIIQYFRSDLSKEMIVKVLYNKSTHEYMVVAGKGKSTKVGIEYDFSDSIPLMAAAGMINVMEIHSHNTMPAFFSETDDQDEQYPGIFGVIGNLDTLTPSICFRAGVQGIYKEIPVNELFF